MLELLTFTGVDTKTSFKCLQEIVDEFPKVEFGILVGSDTGGFNQIFPPLEVVDKFKTLEGNTALHLCGIYSRSVIGSSKKLPEIKELCNGFNRIQINLHGDWENPEYLEVGENAVTQFADGIDCDSIILQHRSGWNSVPIQHDKVEYLFDVSEGQGKESFDLWQEPLENVRVGYAGGIGPHNIERAMSWVSKYPDARMWMDMEGNVRTNGWFDLDKVHEVTKVAFG